MRAKIFGVDLITVKLTPRLFGVGLKTFKCMPQLLDVGFRSVDCVPRYLHEITSAELSDASKTLSGIDGMLFEVLKTLS